MSTENNFPKHIAIIMDGNGRWAEREGKNRISGHKQGAKNVKKIVEACLEKKIETLTLYAFSTENWNRPQKEVEELMNLLRTYLKQNIDELGEKEIKINIIGDRIKLDEDIRKKIKSIEESTKNHNKMTLNLAISYGGRDEIVRAVKRIAGAVKQDILAIEDIDKELISENLYTGKQAEPDLLIRTSGEKRLSNFLLWQSAYSELYFSDKFWPEFSGEDLAEAISDFTKRERKYGI